MGVYKRDERWMVFWNENGKRHDKSFGRGEHARLQAEAFNLAAKEKRVVNGVVVGNIFENIPVAAPSQVSLSQQVATSAVTFSEIANKYLDHLKVSGRTVKHIKNLSVLLDNCFLPIIDRNKPVDSMTYIDDMLPFIKYFQQPSPRTGKPRSQTTINRYCDYMDAIFNFGVENEMTKVNPMSKRKKSKERPRDVKLTVEDMKKIMSFAEPHVCWAMEVCFNFGTRSGESELLSLQWDNIDFEKSTVHIYASKTKTFRTVPIKPSFLEKLRIMKEKALCPYIIEYNGKRVTTLRKSFNNACQKAGITYSVRMYDLRHLFATTLLTNNADLAAVSKLMGHSTVKMTADTYYHYLEGEKERAVALLPEI